MSEFLTIGEVAERYRISIPTIYRLVARGQLTIIKIGRASRLRREAVEAWASSLQGGTGRSAKATG